MENISEAYTTNLAFELSERAGVKTKFITENKKYYLGLKVPLSLDDLERVSHLTIEKDVQNSCEDLENQIGNQIGELQSLIKLAIPMIEIAYKTTELEKQLSNTDNDLEDQIGKVQNAIKFAVPMIELLSKTKELAKQLGNVDNDL